MKKLRIDNEMIGTSKKNREKISLLKTQIQIRRKILCQRTSIVFTTNRKQRPITDIVKELSDLIDASTLPTECATYIKDPTTLVGKQIKHKFKDEDSDDLLWYCGTILAYSHQEKTHCIIYEGENEQYHYDITLDLLNGDLVIL